MEAGPHMHESQSATVAEFEAARARQRAARFQKLQRLAGKRAPWVEILMVLAVLCYVAAYILDRRPVSLIGLVILIPSLLVSRSRVAESRHKAESALAEEYGEDFKRIAPRGH